MCAYNAFLIVIYMFTFGHSLVLGLGVVLEFDWLLSQMLYEELLQAQIFTLLCLVSFHMGALISCGESPRSEDLGVIAGDAIGSRSVKMVGTLLAWGSAAPYIINMANRISVVAMHGYGGLFDYTDIHVVRGTTIYSRVLALAGSFFIPALICLLVTERRSTPKRSLIFLMLLASASAELYIGSRGRAMITILVTGLLYHYVVQRISIRTATWAVAPAYVVVSFLTVIARLRTVAGNDTRNFLGAFVDAFGRENLFIQSIIEIGGTMFPLAMVMRLVERGLPLFYGKSYVYAITTIVPNLGFWTVHPAIFYSEGSHWLMRHLNMSAGPGFSLHADAYRNFGEWGFIFLAVFGALLGRVYSLVHDRTAHSTPARLALVLIFAHGTMFAARGDSLNIVRPLIYIVAPIYLMMYLVDRKWGATRPTQFVSGEKFRPTFAANACGRVE